jgi:hypothetical protein
MQLTPAEIVESKAWAQMESNLNSVLMDRFEQLDPYDPDSAQRLMTLRLEFSVMRNLFAEMRFMAREASTQDFT